VAVEQDPHIRAARDLAKRLRTIGYDFETPSALFIQHLPGFKPE
jgi:tryptophanyl-tRNA synthetase